MKPELSIIIPVYNEEENISKCIESLNKQSYKNFEIIIVDDGSKDRTLEVVKRFKSIKIMKQSHKGPGAARNLGAREAKGEILIFIDADMTFHKKYLEKLIEPIIKKGVIGTEEEAQYPGNLKNIWSRCWGQIRTDPKDTDRKIFRAIKKSEFMKMKGFDSIYGYADDQTFFLRFGAKPSIAKKAICFHDNPESLKEVYKQSRWIGSSSRFKLLEIPVLNIAFVILCILLSPVAILFLAGKKVYKNKEFNLFGWMIIFMFFRYFGNISGYIRKVIFKKNFR